MYVIFDMLKFSSGSKFMSKFFRSGKDINGTNKSKYEDIDKVALGLLIAGIILFIISFIPYLICHVVDILEKDGAWYTILWLVGTFLGPAGMIISAAMLLIWAFMDGHILVLFCFRKWIYLVSFPLLLSGTICLCIFTPAWIWAVLFAPLGFCTVISFLGCFGKFRTERVNDDGKILTLKRINEWFKKRKENNSDFQVEYYEEEISEIEAKAIAEQKRHNLEMEKLAKQQLQYTKCLSCIKNETCSKVTCHYRPKK